MKDIEELLERYRVIAMARGYSLKTIDDVTRPVHLFARYAGDVSALDVTIDTARGFIGWLRDKPVWSGTDHAKERKLGATSINTYVRAVRSFYSLLFIEKVIARNPLAEVKPPKKSKKIPKNFSEADMDRVFAQLEPGSREEVLVLIFLDSGMRLSELLTLPMKRLDLENRRALVVGKGDKERYVYFCDITRKSVEEYIGGGRPHPVETEDSLILSEDGRPMSNSRVQFIIAAIGKKAGIKERLAPHKLRHTFATLSLRYGGNLEYLMRLMGHSDIKTTSEIYLHMDDRDVAAGYDRSSPIAHLKKNAPFEPEGAKPIQAGAPGATPPTSNEIRTGGDFQDAIQRLKKLFITVGEQRLDAAAVLAKLGRTLIPGSTLGEFLTPFTELFPSNPTGFKAVALAGERLVEDLCLVGFLRQEQRRRGRAGRTDETYWVLTDLGVRAVFELENE